MGMFDHVYVEYELPDPEVQFEVFQTKSLDPVMDSYTIDSFGRLIHHVTFWESVPEEKRPYYGTKEWDEYPIFRSFGSINTVHVCDRFMYDFSGEVRFYTNINDYWYEYIAWFKNGLLSDLITKHYKLEQS